MKSTVPAGLEAQPVLAWGSNRRAGHAANLSLGTSNSTRSPAASDASSWNPARAIPEGARPAPPTRQWSPQRRRARAVRRSRVHRDLCW